MRFFFHCFYFLIVLSLNFSWIWAFSKKNYSPWYEQYQSKNSMSDSPPTKLFPGPLFSLGQNILYKGRVSLSFTNEYLQTQQINLLIDSLFFYYGITDKLSFNIQVPFVTYNKQLDKKSTGLGNVLPQFEYVYFEEDLPDAYHRGTVFAGPLFPEPQKKNPLLGSPGWGFLLGSTICHKSKRIYAFGSCGTLLFMHDKNRFGNQYYYELGAGSTLIYNPKYHLSYIFEFNGIYASSNKVHNVLSLNSGFNVIFFGPVLRLRINKFLAMIGIQYPIAQNLFGIQPNSGFDYRMAFLLNWYF